MKYMLKVVFCLLLGVPSVSVYGQVADWHSPKLLETFHSAV